MFVNENIETLAKDIAKAANKRSMKKCLELLCDIPNVAEFFGWQILCDLLESKVLGPNTDNQWVYLGPGAKKGLKRVFRLETTKEELSFTPLLRNLASPYGSQSGFERLGLKFPTFLDKPLSLKNVEHALCEYFKYFRFAIGGAGQGRRYSKRIADNGLPAVKCLLCDEVLHRWCQKNHV